MQNIKKFLKKLSGKAQIKYYKNQIDLNLGILFKHENSVKKVKQKIKDFQEEIYKIEFKDLKKNKPCELDYYSIRAGECRWSETWGRGDIICRNIKCINYSGIPIEPIEIKKS